MTGLRELPDLETTIVEIAVELLLLDKEHRYPTLILGDPDNKTTVRITMHYIMALLTYGFSPEEPELKRAADWFDRTFPKQRPDYIDTIEMNRLMMMMHLRPQNENVQTRLEQLAKQRDRYYFDIQPGWSGFDTLWSLEAFTHARQINILDESLITLDDMGSRLDNLITSRDLKADKDVALALRLQYDLFGELAPRHIEKLHELIASGEANNGVWGLGELEWQKSDMRWYQELTAQRPLVYDDVKSHQRAFRRVIASTCMVIENLTPLVEAYPEVQEALEQAMNLWWQQFKGKTAITTLHSLFPRPHDYDYLLVLCRTLRAVREYIQKPLRTLDTIHLLRQLTEIKTDMNEPSEVRSIKKALRSWIQIDLVDQIESLRLGFSDANIVRVKPQIWSPLTSEDEPESLIRHSLIIKYGPTGMIENERKSYENLPAAIRDYFVRIPESSYVDPETGLAYVIMQDLRDYKTLYETQDAICRHIDEVADLLGNFLERMHDGGSSTLKPVARSLMREIYLSRMIENIDRVFNFVWEHHLFEGTSTIKDIQYALFEAIGKIILRQSALEGFPAAYMHGDLHLRNIMIHGLDNPRAIRNNDVTFKLIDLEFVRPDGDAAFDAGELLIDIELVSREERKHDPRDELLKLNDSLERIYRDFGAKRRDSTFDIRLELAKARALMRIAKGKTKRGSRYVKNNQPALAEQMAEDLIKHAAEALQYLQAVVNALN